MNHFVSIDGLMIHHRFEQHGSEQHGLELNSGLPVVFINSLGSDLRIWDDVVAMLGRSSLRYDKRGHGLSDAPTGPYSIADHANDLHGLLEHLKLERVVTVGISVGGQIALEFASRFPECIAGAVFCDTGMKIGTVELWNARIEAVRDHGLEHISDAVMQRWFGPEFRHEQAALVRGYQNMLERQPSVGYIATCEALRESDLHHAAQNVREARVKTLVICGKDDQSTPVALSQELAQTLGTKLELIDNAGHLPCIEQPEAFAKILNAFLETEANEVNA
jgi:3-oxoadipate enol-lactonase